MMPGIPVQSPVDDRGFHVKQVLGSGSAPSHLLLLAHAPVDQLVDGALHMGGRNTLSVPVRLGVSPDLIHGSHTNRSEARLAWLRFLRTVHCLLLRVPGRAERDQFALWSFRIPPFRHRHSTASISCCSSLPSEPRGVPGNHPHKGDTGIPFRFARSVAQHGTNPDDAGISSQTRCPPPLAIHLRHPTGSSNPCLVLDRSAGERLAPASLHTDPGPAPRRRGEGGAGEGVGDRVLHIAFKLGGKAISTNATLPRGTQ